MSDTGMFLEGPDGILRLPGWWIKVSNGTPDVGMTPATDAVHRVRITDARKRQIAEEIVALARSDDSDPVEVVQDVEALVRKIDAAEKNS